MSLSSLFATRSTDPEVLRLRGRVVAAQEEDPRQIGVMLSDIDRHPIHARTQVQRELESVGYTVDTFGHSSWIIARRQPDQRAIAALRASVAESRRRDGRQMRGTFVVFLTGHPDPYTQHIVRAELEEDGYIVEEALGQWSITPRRTPYMAPALAAPTLERHYADGREYLPPGVDHDTRLFNARQMERMNRSMGRY